LTSADSDRCRCGCHTHSLRHRRSSSTRSTVAFSAQASAPEVEQRRVDLALVEPGWVVRGKLRCGGAERVSGPAEELLVGPLGVGDNVKQFLVAVDSAAVLRRPGASARDAAQPAAGTRRESFLDLDRVSPVVTEVVDVAESITDSDEATQPDVLGSGFEPTRRPVRTPRRRSRTGGGGSPSSRRRSGSARAAAAG
jgi:hypothetical protein